MVQTEAAVTVLTEIVGDLELEHYLIAMAYFDRWQETNVSAGSVRRGRSGLPYHCERLVLPMLCARQENENCLLDDCPDWEPRHVPWQPLMKYQPGCCRNSPCGEAVEELPSHRQKGDQPSIRANVGGLKQLNRQHYSSLVHLAGPTRLQCLC